MNRPFIIAICGKSATGKDTLAKYLQSMLDHLGFKTNIIVSDTTRPCRVGERNGVEYNFLTDETFKTKINNHEYLEYAHFNSWLYGTNKQSILQDSVNIGVFNLNGINSLVKYNEDYQIICIYLECKWYRRLLRSIKREESIKYEFIRRLYVDYRDFQDVELMLKRFPYHYHYFTDTKSCSIIADHIIRRLRTRKLLPYNKRR